MIRVVLAAAAMALLTALADGGTVAVAVSALAAGAAAAAAPRYGGRTLAIAVVVLIAAGTALTALGAPEAVGQVLIAVAFGIGFVGLVHGLPERRDGRTGRPLAPRV